MTIGHLWRRPRPYLLNSAVVLDQRHSHKPTEQKTRTICTLDVQLHRFFPHWLTTVFVGKLLSVGTMSPLWNRNPARPMVGCAVFWERRLTLCEVRHNYSCRIAMPLSPSFVHLLIRMFTQKYCCKNSEKRLIGQLWNSLSKRAISWKFCDSTSVRVIVASSHATSLCPRGRISAMWWSNNLHWHCYKSR